MAMTRKEKDAYNNVIAELKDYKRFHLTEKVLPDVVYENAQDVLTGYVVNQYTLEVKQAAYTVQQATQMGGLYSTKELAYKAMRNKVEEECLKLLRKVDNVILSNT